MFKEITVPAEDDWDSTYSPPEMRSSVKEFKYSSLVGWEGATGESLLNHYKSLDLSRQKSAASPLLLKEKEISSNLVEISLSENVAHYDIGIVSISEWWKETFIEKNSIKYSVWTGAVYLKFEPTDLFADKIDPVILKLLRSEKDEDRIRAIDKLSIMPLFSDYVEAASKAFFESTSPNLASKIIELFERNVKSDRIVQEALLHLYAARPDKALQQQLDDAILRAGDCMFQTFKSVLDSEFESPTRVGVIRVLLRHAKGRQLNALPLLQKLATSLTNETRYQAAFALASYEKVDVFVNLLKNPEADIRRAAILALGECARNEVLRVDAVPLILSLKDDHEAIVRSGVIQSVAPFVTPDTDSIIVAGMGDSDHNVRYAALNALKSRMNRVNNVYQELRKRVEDSDFRCRLLALTLLKRLPAKEITTDNLELLYNETATVVALMDSFARSSVSRRQTGKAMEFMSTPPNLMVREACYFLSQGTKLNG